MRISKTFLGAFLTMALPVFAWAEDTYLLWMQIIQPEQSAVLFDFARVANADDFSQTYPTYNGPEYFFSEDNQTSTEKQMINLGNYTSISGVENVSFVIELFAFTGDESFRSVAQSSVISYADFQASVFKSGEATPTTTYTVSAFTIPEPTSGLMLLLGLAALGLKRKNITEVLAENMV